MKTNRRNFFRLAGLTGLALDQDVYDTALWSAIAPLSEWSVANRSNSIDVPDFTRGS